MYKNATVFPSFFRGELPAKWSFNLFLYVILQISIFHRLFIMTMQVNFF